MDETIQVVRCELQTDCSGSSLYLNGIHFIFINVNVSPEEQEKAEKRELARILPK